jgi:hypothetical protein
MIADHNIKLIAAKIMQYQLIMTQNNFKCNKNRWLYQLKGLAGSADSYQNI